LKTQSKDVPRVAALHPDVRGTSQTAEDGTVSFRFRFYIRQTPSVPKKIVDVWAGVDCNQTC
jgi:hypothetical protein